MNRLLILSALFVLTSAALPRAAGATERGGPLGGRLLTDEAPVIEFFVLPDRRVALTFYNDELHPVSAGAHEAVVIVEAPSGRISLELSPATHGFESAEPLPAGDGYRIVVQIRPEPGAKPSNFRIDFVDHQCGECGHVEYACTCEGH